MKNNKFKRNQNTLSLSPDMKISDVIRLWPQTLNTFIRMGFTPLKNPLLRKTVAGLVTIEKAAFTRNIDLNILMLNLQNSITNPTERNEGFIDPDKLRYDENTIPDLNGEINLVGLIPCPISNIVTEMFDAFIQKNYSSKKVRLAWWIAAEGGGTVDIKNYVVSIAKSGLYESFPDYFMAVGTELFLHDDYCRKMYHEDVFIEGNSISYKRPEFEKLEDPNKKLNLQFLVYFTFYCTPETMDDLPLPETWFDLTNPEYKGKIVLPSLNLPVIPDFLAALYYHLGDSLFVQFCRNVSFALHPSQSSSRKIKKNSPSIFITPIHFSNIIKSKGHVHIVPEDGPVAVPAYYVKTSSKPKARSIENYLTSKELMEVYYKNGSFIPNRKDILIEYPLDNIITRPWASLFDIIPDNLLEQLLQNFKLSESI